MPHKSDCVIGIDAGTTGLKSLVFDLTGNCLAKSYREYPLYHPRPDWVEQNPEDWWTALVETLREVLAIAEVAPQSIAGLCISFQGSTVIALDAKSEVIRPAISWLDKRSAEAPLSDEWEEEALFASTGLRFSPAWTGPILRWLSLYEPETVRRAAKFTLVGDYLIHKLTGAIMTDFSSASRTRLFHLARQEWDEGIVASHGIGMAQLPSLGNSGQIASGLSAEAAALTGLLEGTPVMLGGFDQMCAGLGAGAISPETLMVSLGTATMLLVAAHEPLVDPQRRLTTSCHVIPRAWTLQAPIMTTGALLRWWRDHFFPEKSEDPYREMDALAEKAPIGSNGLFVFPHFSGGGAPWWDHSRRGAFVGLSLAHDAGHIVRAILEGIAMEIRINMETLESLGLSIESVRIVGGGAGSGIWRAIIADVLGIPQQSMREVEVGALGAAILAAFGAGAFASLEEAVNAMARPGDASSFSAENHREYLKVYSQYMDWSRKLYGAAPWEPAERCGDMLGLQALSEG